MWDKPQKVETTEEWRDNHGADGAPPGCYSPNMSAADRRRWKAKLTGTKSGFPQIEIRKDSTVIILSRRGYKYRHYDTRQGDFPERRPWTLAQADAKVCVHIASAGPLQLTLDELDEMQQAIKEAMNILKDLEEGVVR